MKNETGYGKFLLTSIMLLGWFALIAQLWLMLQTNEGTYPIFKTIINFISFYTILTNLLVAVYSTTALVAPASKIGNFMFTPTFTTAVTVHITIVGLIYNMILRFTWQPQGLQRVADELLHLIIPLLFIVYWSVFKKKNTLKWKDVWLWMVYPIVYLAYILARGAVNNLYPYPFVDANKLGYQKVALNCVGICALFFLVALIFIAIGKKTAVKKI